MESNRAYYCSGPTLVGPGGRARPMKEEDMRKDHLLANGLDPEKELARHERLADAYRQKMKALGRRRGWPWQDYRDSAIYHTEQAMQLRQEGVGKVEETL